MKKIKSINYHGFDKNNFFEGWYYKQVSLDEKNIISFIPGVSLNETESHSFIQVLMFDGDKKLSAYNIKYSLDDFKTNDNPFEVWIKDNYFSEKKMIINIDNEDLKINGQIEFENLVSIKTSKVNPDIMGVFSYIPNMECNHGIISMNHYLLGQLNVNNETIDFDGGKGYIEKDWGTSFPKEYIWIQSNNFDNPSASIFCSVADVPFMGKSFHGFICNFVFDGNEYRFSTYNFSKFKMKNNENLIELIFSSKDKIIYIEAKIIDYKKLLSPTNGKMSNTIKEGLSGTVRVILKDKNNKVIFDSIGRCAGIDSAMKN